MFQFFRKLMSWFAEFSGKPFVAKEVDSQSSDGFARLDGDVPLKDATNVRHAFVRREAILNRAEKIAGYEFSLLTSLQARMYRGGGMAKRAYDAALLARLSSYGVSSLLGRRLAFVGLSVDSLSNALINQLPPQNTVLIVDITEQTGSWEDVSVRLAELRELGFALGLGHVAGTEANFHLLEKADFVEIDVTDFDALDLRTLTRNLKKVISTGKEPLQLIARNVQSHEDFQFCNKCGFDLFQGPFISSRESFHQLNGGVNHMAVLRIVNMVLEEQNFSLIAEQLKHEPILTYKLLRYINSAAIGLQKPVDSVTEALVLIGREKFSRWTSLLLFDFTNPTYRERLLAERAMTRGRTLELIAGSGRIPNDQSHLFLIGLFSLLDQVLGRPLPELLEKASLPDVVRDALLGKESAYSDALALAILGEAGTSALPEQMAQLLGRCGVDESYFTAKAAEALVWTDKTLSEIA